MHGTEGVNSVRLTTAKDNLKQRHRDRDHMSETQNQHFIHLKIQQRTRNLTEKTFVFMYLRRELLTTGEGNSSVLQRSLPPEEENTTLSPRRLYRHLLRLFLPILMERNHAGVLWQPLPPLSLHVPCGVNLLDTPARFLGLSILQIMTVSFPGDSTKI